MKRNILLALITLISFNANAISCGYYNTLSSKEQVSFLSNQLILTKAMVDGKYSASTVKKATEWAMEDLPTEILFRCMGGGMEDVGQMVKEVYEGIYITPE